MLSEKKGGTSPEMMGKPVDLTKPEIMFKQDFESSVACSVRTIAWRDLNPGLRLAKLVRGYMKDQLNRLITIVN